MLVSPSPRVLVYQSLSVKTDGLLPLQIQESPAPSRIQSRGLGTSPDSRPGVSGRGTVGESTLSRRVGSRPSFDDACAGGRTDARTDRKRLASPSTLPMAAGLGFPRGLIRGREFGMLLVVLRHRYRDRLGLLLWVSPSGARQRGKESEDGPE